MTKSEQELKACRKKYSTLARETAKGMWPGKGSTGQNTEIILDTILEVIRQECMASKPTLEEVLVGLAEKERIHAVALVHIDGCGWLITNDFRVQISGTKSRNTPTEAALVAKDENDG